MDDRLKRHQSGWITATKHRLPVELQTYIVFEDKYKAFNFEKYLKSGSGRAFLKKRLNPCSSADRTSDSGSEGRGFPSTLLGMVRGMVSEPVLSEVEVVEPQVPPRALLDFL